MRNFFDFKECISLLLTVFEHNLHIIEGLRSKTLEELSIIHISNGLCCLLWKLDMYDKSRLPKTTDDNESFFFVKGLACN